LTRVFAADHSRLYYYQWAFGIYRIYGPLPVSVTSPFVGARSGHAVVSALNLALTATTATVGFHRRADHRCLLTLILSTAFSTDANCITIFLATWPDALIPNPERVLIVGINETASICDLIYLRRSKPNYELVGFVDDDYYRKG